MLLVSRKNLKRIILLTNIYCLLMLQLKYLFLELQKKIFLFTSIGAVANIVLNLWLVPKWGAVGSAWATVLSYSVFGVIVQLIVRSTRQVMLGSLHSLLLPILCVLPLAVVVYMLKDVTLFVPVVAGSAIYTIMLFATRCIDETDKDYVRQVFGKDSDSSL